MISTNKRMHLTALLVAGDAQRREGCKTVELDVSFGVPKHGWLPVTVETPSRFQQRDVSDALHDSLTEFTNSLLRLASSDTLEERVSWTLEPDEWIWVLLVRGDRLEFRVIDGDDAIATEVQKREGLSMLFRSMSALGANEAWSRNKDLTVWSWSFPHDGLARLGKLLQDP